jgi:hypothetical protein
LDIPKNAAKTMLGYSLKSFKNHAWISLKILQKLCLDIPKNAAKTMLGYPLNPTKNFLGYP